MKKSVLIMAILWLFSNTSLAGHCGPCTFVIKNTTATEFPYMNVIIGACSGSIAFVDGIGWALKPGGQVSFQLLSTHPPCNQSDVKWGEYYTSQGGWARCFFFVALTPTETGYALAEKGSFGYCKGADYLVIPQMNPSTSQGVFTIIDRSSESAKKKENIQ